VDLFVSRFVVRMNGNQTKITVTILPPDDRIVVLHVLVGIVQTFSRNITSTWHRNNA
jgi:hypothetical protein